MNFLLYLMAVLSFILVSCGKDTRKDMSNRLNEMIQQIDTGTDPQDLPNDYIKRANLSIKKQSARRDNMENGVTWCRSRTSELDLPANLNQMVADASKFFENALNCYKSSINMKVISVSLVEEMLVLKDKPTEEDKFNIKLNNLRITAGATVHRMAENCRAQDDFAMSLFSRLDTEYQNFRKTTPKPQ